MGYQPRPSNPFSLLLDYSRASVVREGEEHAEILMNASYSYSPPICDPVGDYEWWVSTFGASKDEFEDIRDDMVRRYRGTSFWRRRRRQTILTEYAKIEGLLAAASGITIGWR